MSGAAKLTDRQKSRLQFALELLERHRAAVDRAVLALQDVTASAEYAEWARQSAAALREEIGDDYREFVKQRLGLAVEKPEPAPTEEAQLENSTSRPLPQTTESH